MCKRTELIGIVVSDDSFRAICKKVSVSYSDDIYQHVCEKILTMPESRLPDHGYLKFWFYRVANNCMSKTGEIGKGTWREEPTELSSTYASHLSNKSAIIDQKASENMLSCLESTMLSLTEFENRIALMYVELGDMKAVQRTTGISYSALRQVKEKLKTLR